MAICDLFARPRGLTVRLTWELRDYRLALVSSLSTAHGVVTHREGVLFSMSDGMNTGWGEAAPLPGWSRESVSDCRKALESAVARLAQYDGIDDPRLTAMLFELEAWPHARAAVAGATVDLLARSHEMSLASLLRARPVLGSALPGSLAPEPDPPYSVLVNGLISHPQPEGVALAAAALAKEGISAVKLKVAAADPQTDLARVAATRAALGDDIELRLDANGGWDIDTAIVTLRQMADYNVAFCEEPTAGIKGIAAVGLAGVMPVAVDESAVTVNDITTALQTDAIGVVIVKPQALGGPDLAMSAIALAEDFGATAVVTSMIDSAIGVAHAAHVAAAALPQQAHGLHTSTLLTDDVAPRLMLRAGKLNLPEVPGLGVAPVS